MTRKNESIVSFLLPIFALFVGIGLCIFSVMGPVEDNKISAMIFLGGIFFSVIANIAILGLLGVNGFILQMIIGVLLAGIGISVPIILKNDRIVLFCLILVLLGIFFVVTAIIQLFKERENKYIKAMSELIKSGEETVRDAIYVEDEETGEAMLHPTIATAKSFLSTSGKGIVTILSAVPMLIIGLIAIFNRIYWGILVLIFVVINLVEGITLIKEGRRK